MRTILSIAAAATMTGCMWSNPYDASDLRYRLTDEDQKQLQLEVLSHQQRPLPRQQAPQLRDDGKVVLVAADYELPVDPVEKVTLDVATPGDPRPNLTTWKATVLEKADANELAQMERDSRERVARLQGLVDEYDRSSYRVYHYPLMVTQRQLELERAKLVLISAARGR